MNHFAEAMQTIRRVRQETDTAVLFYSAGGKDGIALLDMLATTFRNVICYYMYVVPNLEHVQPYITWAEKKYGNVEVRQIVHYQKDSIDKIGMFKDPDPAYNLPRKDPRHKRVRSVGDVEESVRKETGQHYVFSGMKGIDGYMKRMRLLMYRKRNPEGFFITDKGMVYPLAQWTNGEVLQYIQKRNLIKPFVYIEGEASQGYGVDLQTLLFLRKNYPNDYQKTLKEFPYAKKLLWDYQNGKVNTATKDAVEAKKEQQKKKVKSRKQ